jgi:hypothetical protein
MVFIWLTLTVYLGLVCDALQGLFDLSFHLQEGSMDLYRANKKIEAFVQLFYKRQMVLGAY